MFSIGAISFATPAVLMGLLALPAIWWLLRVTPPTPQRIRFPALKFLLNLEQEDHTSAHTPWWVLALRLLISFLIILALADPIINPTEESAETDVLVIAVDDGWTSAPDWSERQNTLLGYINQAERDDTPIILFTTAPSITENDGSAYSLATPKEAKGIAQALTPQPWLPDRGTTITGLKATANTLKEQDLKSDVIWFSDGLDHKASSEFVEALTELGPLTILTSPTEKRAWAMMPPEGTADGFSATILRSHDGKKETGQLQVLGERERILGVAEFAFEKGTPSTSVDIEMPLELRNQAQYMQVINQQSAGLVSLLDERWKRRLVGLVSSGNVESSQPLLSELYYLERALSPYTELRKGSIEELIKQGVSVLVLADRGQIVGSERNLVEDWLNEGGLLLRFAGPRMAGQSDDLTPVPLRQGGRALGGALSWDAPQKLGGFSDSSPFEGLTIPDDVTITRQVLAQPSIDLPERTWARLTDGTPLVTAAPRSKGWIVLFHVTASPKWSTLPLSGLYVDMLRRVTRFSSTMIGGAFDPDAESDQSTQSLRPLRLLNGFGQLTAPNATATAITSSDLTTKKPTPRHPPGFYGTEDRALALNPVAKDLTLSPLSGLPSSVNVIAIQDDETRALKPTLLLIAFALMILDGFVALLLSGRLTFHKPALTQASLTLFIIGSLLASSPFAFAQEEAEDAFALKATIGTPLAYVITGVSEVDNISAAGMKGLSRALLRRTAMEPADPIGLNMEKDELAFFPLIYWPIIPQQSELSPEALAKIDLYMKNGGTILFDTQDHQTNIPGLGGSQSGNETLKALLASLDIPPLEPVPADHVLTKAFYLLQDFPGRWSGGRLWVEALDVSGDVTGQSSRDGVSTIIIGSNDYAAAWAEDDQGRPLLPVVPGGTRQREMAMRFGINLVMYTLTGNYKADQVHVPALLERLGQ